LNATWSAAVALLSSGVAGIGAASAETTSGSSKTAAKALFFDVFGTLVDWRTGVARDAAEILKPLGYSVEWLAFADAWRGEYQPAVEEVHSGRVPFSKLDVLHRRMLERTLAWFAIKDVPEEHLRNLNLAWHRPDGWADVGPGLGRLGHRYLLAPVSNGNFSLMA